MNPVFTVLVSVGAILFMAGLGILGGTDSPSLLFFVCWTGAPYLGYCALALARRAPRTAIFVNTLISAGLASIAYLSDSWPFILARARGEEMMNCAGPLIEFGVPLLQWVHVLFLFVLIKFLTPAASELGVGETERGRY